MGTPSQTAPVKSISIQKADCDRQSSEVVVDALFWFDIASRGSKSSITSIIAKKMYRIDVVRYILGRLSLLPTGGISAHSSPMNYINIDIVLYL